MQIETGFGPSKAIVPLRVVAANAPAPAPLLPYDRGHQLFVAKGCVSCHSHLVTKEFNLTNLGPDLTEPKFAAAYLQRFLANPAVKTDWKSGNRMPNLGLKPAEITALVAFLNQEKK
jgi:cytochrome c2